MKDSIVMLCLATFIAVSYVIARIIEYKVVATHRYKELYLSALLECHVSLKQLNVPLHGIGVRIEKDKTTIYAECNVKEQVTIKSICELNTTQYKNLIKEGYDLVAYLKFSQHLEE